MKPVIVITLAFLSGLLLGRGSLYFPFTITVLVTTALFASGLLLRSGRLSLRQLALIAVPCILGIASSVYSAAYLPPDHYTRLLSPAEAASPTMAGRIVSPLDRGPDRTAFVMELREFDGAPASGKVRVSVRDEQTGAGFGDTLRLSGRLYRPRGFNNPGAFDYPAYLAAQGIYGTVALKDAGGIGLLLRGRGIFRTIQDWRERIRRSFLASTTGAGSAILQAMVLGEEGGLTDEMRDRFMAAGVTHIISISGSHLGMVAVICFALIRSLMLLMPEHFYHRMTIHADPKKIAAWLTLPLVIFYTVLAGGQVATIRSLVMISAALFALILDRENGLMHSLAAAALLILIVSPQAVFDISFQLSYISVLSIGSVVMLWNDLQFKANGVFQKMRNSAILLIIISLSTSLATGPLVVHYFNQVSLAGVIANMIVVPFAGLVVVPLGLGTGILSLFTHRLPLAAANQAAADAFVNVVSFFSRLPFAEFHPPAPSVFWLLIYTVFLVSAGGYVRSRLLYRFRPFESTSGVSKFHVAVIAGSGAVLTLLLALSLFSGHPSRVSFIDVGQGDCALMELSSGKNILIDGGGTYDNRFDIGRRVVAPFLWNRGVRHLDLVVLSHPHPDHMNGLTFIARKFRVSEMWENGQAPDMAGYRDLKQAVNDRGIRCRTAEAGAMTARIGEAEVRVLHPTRGFSERSKKAYINENNRSLVLRITADGNVFLFPGDIEAGAEVALVRQYGHDLKCDLLKVPHHGSKSSSAETFVSMADPAIAVVTVGRGNPYRQPSDDVIARYEKHGAHVYRTDRDGALVATVEKDKLIVQPWASLTLQRIVLDDRLSSWVGRERENWKKLGIRLLS
jgi:competence protein ComEC